MRRAGLWILTAAIVLYSLFPFFWILKSSLEPTSSVIGAVKGLWPGHPTLTHYQAIFVQGGFGQPLLNSTIVAGSTTVLAVVLGALAAYALARLPMRGKAIVLGSVLLVSFFPQIAMVGPLFLVFRHLQWLDTYQALVVPYLILSLPITTWILTAFFAQIPRELEEAAMVDGAGLWRTLWSVFAPVAIPGLFTAAILDFLLSWNDLLFALSFMNSPNMYTVPLALVNFRNAYYVHYGQVYAGVIVASLPIALVVLFLQRRIASGLTAGSVKG